MSLDHAAAAPIADEALGADVDILAINTIRTLAIDAVEAAQSGHAGLPMGMAPVGYTLWRRFLRYDPERPLWPNRDRFVLSAGHGCMLLYALLLLAGVKAVGEDGEPTGRLAVDLDDIKRFRQLGSVCPGHPEHGHTTGVETTTGPLGQGAGNSVGMAIAARWLAARYNRPGCALFDYNVFALCSDGDLMEGVASEAASLAGHLKLANLCWIYDDNHVTIEGSTDLAFSEDVVRRFRAYGWPEDAQFLVPDGVRERMQAGISRRGAELSAAWDAMLERYRAANPELAAELDTLWAGDAPAGWDAAVPSFPADAKGLASREASGKVLNAIGPQIPWLAGGSADLAPSNKTLLEFDGAGSFEAGAYGGRNLHFGVREHAMGAIANGLALSGLRPYAGTFLVFSDYMRPPIRLAALMDLPVTFVFTHDSIGLGQDGPTHQPIEHLAALRAIPNLTVIRPCDANETAQAWRTILDQRGPACLVLSRQALPTIDRGKAAPATGLERGAYVLVDPDDGAPDVILMASGSEVALCLEAAAALAGDNVRARVVSMPSWELFEAQPRDYREQVLPETIAARVAVEAGAAQGWDRYVGGKGEVIAMHRFGASAPIKDLMPRFGFTADHVRSVALAQIEAAREARR